MAKETNMAMVLQALKNAGLNDNQAKILGAEIGRENAFQDKYLWGYHVDPKNRAINIGIISWQGNRGKGVEKALQNAGLIKDGRIVKGQDSLNVMAKYLVDEIRTNPTYAASRKQFLENPNVDYKTGNQVLGRNFIRWRYDDPKFASGHKNRDKFYTQLGGVLSSGIEGTQLAEGASTTQPMLAPPVAPQISPVLPTRYSPIPPMDTFSAPSSNPLGLNLDLMATLQGIGAQQQNVAPLLPVPFINL